jgi:hypothetical protein
MAVRLRPVCPKGDRVLQHATNSHVPETDMNAVYSITFLRLRTDVARMSGARFQQSPFKYPSRARRDMRDRIPAYRRGAPPSARPAAHAGYKNPGAAGSATPGPGCVKTLYFIMNRMIRAI